MPRTNEHSYWLYEHKYESSESFLDYVSGFVRGTKARINVLVVSIAAEISGLFESWVPEGFSLEIKNPGTVMTLAATREVNENERITVQARIVSHPSFPGVYLIISDCNTNDFKRVITRLIDLHYPIISRIFLTNTELRIIFDKLRDSTGLDIIVESSVGKRRLPGRKKKKSQVTYTDQPYDEVFDEIGANDQWVQSIRYRAEKVVRIKSKDFRTTQFYGLVDRACFFSSRRDFTPVIEIVIPLAIKLASIRNEYLKISVETAERSKPEPLVIKFGQDVFADVSKNRQYVDALTELESCSVSEYHTNPYIHISLLDYLDGSSYDLWVLSFDRMFVIPEFKASIASMSRLVNHIFERIHEGKIEKYEDIVIDQES